MRNTTFTATQLAFTEYLRAPSDAITINNVDLKRLQLYRELVVNNMSSLLSTEFPVIRSIYTDTAWRQLVKDFLAEYRPHTPYFYAIGGEFVDYLSSARQQQNDPPYLLELAHYEWIELALDLATTTIEWQSNNNTIDLLNCVPIVSPLACLLKYQFPVHRIGANYQPQEPPAEPTLLIVWRDRFDKVNFMHLNLFSARLIEILQDNTDKSGHEVLQQIIAESQHPNPATVLAGGKDLLHQLQQQDIILTNPSSTAF